MDSAIWGLRFITPAQSDLTIALQRCTRKKSVLKTFRWNKLWDITNQSNGDTSLHHIYKDLLVCLEPLLRGLGHADPGSLVQALQVPTIMFIMMMVMRIVWLDYYLLGNTSQEKSISCGHCPKRGGEGLVRIF